VSPVILTPLTIKVPPDTVKPVTTSNDAVNTPPLSSYIVKLLLSLYVNPVTQHPPVSNNLQLEFAVPPLCPWIVDPVQALIKDCPATELLFTVVPNFDWTTVGPPGPEAANALVQRVV